MITRSIKEIPIATVDASSHKDLLTDRELMSSQLKEGLNGVVAFTVNG